MAREYLKRGDRVTSLDINPTKLEGVTHIAYDLGGTLIPKLDVYDTVICNAGIALSGNFIDHSAEENKKLMHVNTHGHMELIKHMLKHDKIKEGGRIGFVTSASVYFPWPVAIGYATSKAALDGFAHALESYVAHKDISITRIYPGPMKTAHEKYYEGISEGKGSDPALIAPRVVRAIENRKRKMFPDMASKIMRIGSMIAPRLIAKKMNEKYKSHLRKP